MIMDGWKINENLPPNWLLKSSGNSLTFCSPEGKVIKSKEKLIKYFKSKMSQEELMKLKLFCGTVKAENKRSFQEVKKVDESWIDGSYQSICPIGWKFKYSKLEITTSLGSYHQMGLVLRVDDLLYNT